MNEMKSVQHPCMGCVYFKACGESSRTMLCEGRETKTMSKNSEKTSRLKEKKLLTDQNLKIAKEFHNANECKKL